MPNQYTSPPAMERFAAQVETNVSPPSHCPDFGPCAYWTAFVAPDGYGMFWLEGKNHVAHRAAWMLSSGAPIPAGMKVCHACDVRRCVQTDGIGTYTVDGVSYERRGHLWLGTTAANQADMAAKGRALSGERNARYTHPETTARGARNARFTHPEATARGGRHGNTSLTEAIVLDIRARYAAGGITLQQLADEYGTGKSTMHRIIRRLYWLHI